MIRTTALTAAALVGLTLVAPTSATAAGETCRGVPATLVGSPGDELVGTDGPDVVVTNGAGPVRTLGGDDLVCVTGDINDRVDAGVGDDVVDRSQDRAEFTTTVLGPGSDQFVGSAASDVVWAGTKPRRALVDRDRDVIDGGPPGPEYGDYVISGEAGQTNPDEVRLGGGTSVRGGSAGTVELYGTPTPQTVLAGTRGSELTLETTDAHRVSIDTTAGTYTRDGATAALSGFATFQISNKVETRYIDFRGSGVDESITMDTTRSSAYDIRMGGGSDEIVVETDRIHRRVNVFDGGGGHDQLGIVMPRKEVRLDLRRGRLLAGKERNAVAARATGFEDAEVVAGLIELTGTRGDNDLRADGCDVRVRALGGDDKVSPLTLLYDQLLHCRSPKARIVGGRGDDHLAGDGGPDVLLGGPGRDRANGSVGRDTCRAEKMRSCERRKQGRRPARPGDTVAPMSDELPETPAPVDPARSFGSVAEAYDRGRPAYPEEAVAWLSGGEAKVVLELGAGTGKLTRQLVDAGHAVFATDPDAAMLEVLRERVPEVSAKVATAEEIPANDRSVDVVVVAQAFHWFDHEVALPEIARVLKPGGHVALIWNSRDERIPWVRRLGDILGRQDSNTSSAQHLVHSKEFGFMEEATFKHWQEVNRETVLDLARSRSSFATMDDAEREDHLARLLAFYDDYGRGMDGMRIPYVTRCYRAVVVDRDEPTTSDGAASSQEGPVVSDGSDTDMLLIDFR